MKEIEIIKIGMSEQWNKMVNQMVAEQDKGVNRLIAIIRENGREFENKHRDSELKAGGFVKFVKKEIENKDWPEDFKRALKYL